MYENFKRSQWFRHDRFGMFIHWGIYSIPARGEWVRSVERISNEEYQKYFEVFTPWTMTRRNGRVRPKRPE